ncbi:uncharacterized protein LOC132260725 [Phlebotomus argentipes]|uniref:uncharacterized protein LOC132260725 n=1 Tax=Phlebotomus argentipes TaxID=94469 RepID=UPI002892A822|nr:uncharacterized protein LOC132260725 [Phlebotomus argentipes]
MPKDHFCREFIQDEDKNTVWGTSYEESAESNVPLNNSSLEKKYEDNNISVAMEIDPELAVHHQMDPLNKENEIPDVTIWSGNISRKAPLASSTMLGDTEMDISLRDQPNVRKESSKQFMKSPPRLLKTNPFAWLADPKVVGKDALSECTFVPSPLTQSQMMRESTCNFNISSLHDDLKENQSRLKVMEMNEKLRGYAEQDQISLNFTEIFPDKKRRQLSDEYHLELTEMTERKISNLPEVSKTGRRTIYFTKEDNEMTVCENPDGNRTKNLQKTIHFASDGEQMNISRYQDDQKGNRSVRCVEMEMSLNTPTTEISKQDRKTRKTELFSADNNQMNLTDTKVLFNTEGLEKTIQKKRKTTVFSPNDNDIDITGVSDERTVQGMRICHQDSIKLIRKDRKTVYYSPEDNNIDVTGSSGQDLTDEMDICTQETKNVTSKDRKSVYFRPGENDMIITGVSVQNPEREISITPQETAKAARKDRQTVFFPPENNRMNITEVCDQEISLCSQNTGKVTSAGRKTVYFSSDGNEMNMTGISGREPQQEMSICPQDANDVTKMDRRTVYFSTERNGINISGVSNQDLQQEMSVCTLETKTVTNKDRKSVYYRPGENDMNITGVVRQELQQEMSIYPQSTEEVVRNDRQTVFFPPENNGMNITGVSDQECRPEMSICPQEMESKTKKDRRTIYFPSGGNEMNITGVSSEEQSICNQGMNKIGKIICRTNLYPAECSEMNITGVSGHEMSICVQNAVKTDKNNRRTVFFPPGKNQMNLTMNIDESDGKSVQEMRISPEPYRDAVWFDRRSIPHELNTMNVSEVHSQLPAMDMSYLAQKSEKDQMEIENENPIIGGVRRKMKDGDKRLTHESLEKSFGQQETEELRSTMEKLDIQPTDASLKKENFGEMPEDWSKANCSVQNSTVSCEMMEESKLSDTKMLMEESYVEAASIMDNTSADMHASPNMTLDNTIFRVTKVVPELGEWRPREVPSRNIRRETFTIHKNSRKSEVEVDIPKSLSSTIESVKISSNRSLTYENTTLGSIFIESEHERSGAPVELHQVTQPDQSLVDFLGSDLFEILSNVRGAKAQALEVRERVFHEYNTVKQHLEYFHKCPNRFQLPLCPNYRDLVGNMVENHCQSIWFIDKFMDKGLMMFKHRKITTFEIHMKFQPRLLRNMDYVQNRGCLVFDSIEVRDTDWYIGRDPATKSKLWIYLHNKFRRQVLMDSYLLNKYRHSNDLRDFLQYIDRICCDIYAARPRAVELIRMFKNGELNA